MRKEFVSYEIALALKELGFDEPCISVYYVDKRLSEPMSTWAITNDNTNSKIKSDLISCSVPTFSQAFRWFREKHKLAVDIRSEHLGYYTSIVDRKKMMRIVMKPVNIFETYEGAEQACLDKLIEIVKNKQHE